MADQEQIWENFLKFNKPDDWDDRPYSLEKIEFAYRMTRQLCSKVFIAEKLDTRR